MGMCVFFFFNLGEMRSVNLITRAHFQLSHWQTILSVGLGLLQVKRNSICTILLCNIATVMENQTCLIKGSIRVLCQLGPMKEHFPNQHPSDILVAF